MDVQKERGHTEGHVSDPLTFNWRTWRRHSEQEMEWRNLKEGDLIDGQFWV